MYSSNISSFPFFLKYKMNGIRLCVIFVFIASFFADGKAEDPGKYSMGFKSFIV